MLFLDTLLRQGLWHQPHQRRLSAGVMSTRSETFNFYLYPVIDDNYFPFARLQWKSVRKNVKSH